MITLRGCDLCSLLMREFRLGCSRTFICFRIGGLSCTHSTVSIAYYLGKSVSVIMIIVVGLLLVMFLWMLICSYFFTSI